MGVMMNLIMLGCTYPIVLIMYVFMKLEIGDKRRRFLGLQSRKNSGKIRRCWKSVGSSAKV